ncbi:MAG: hypothetical protein ACREO8_01350 [Luteimonas sp.]
MKTAISAVPSSSTAPVPTDAAASVEVPGKATRRRFTLAYKRRLVTLATGLASGEIGVLLRREGLYSSHLTNWRQPLAAVDAKVAEPTRGRKPDPTWPDRLKFDKLHRENARLQQRLMQAEAIIDAQKKS